MTDWQPIETAPKDGTHVLLFWRGGHQISHWRHTQHFQNGRISYDNAGWADPYGSLGRESSGPSHWMPLPDKPTQEG